MSHFTRIELEFKDRDALLEAFLDLGYSNIQQGASVRGFNDQEMPADFVVRGENGYDIGLVSAQGRFLVVADWMGIPGGQEALLSRLKQAYAERVLRRKLTSQGHSIVKRQQLPNGDVVFRIQLPKEAEIRVLDSGGITVEGLGFTGPECVEATSSLESALGSQVGEKELKPDPQKASQGRARLASRGNGNNNAQVRQGTSQS